MKVKKTPSKTSSVKRSKAFDSGVSKMSKEQAIEMVKMLELSMNEGETNEGVL